MAGQNIKAGGAYVEISAKTDALSKGLAVAQKHLDSFAAKMGKLSLVFGGAGAAILAPFVKSLNIFQSYGDEIEKMSKRTGFSVESLSALAHAAELSGTSIETLERGLQGLSRGLVGVKGIDDGAVADTEQMRQALKELGLSFQQFKDLSPEDRLLAVADAIKNIPDPMQKAAIAMKIFGKSGAELIPLLNEGSSGIKAMMAEAKELGIVLDGKTASAAALLNDQLTRVRKSILGVELAIAATLAPYVIKLANLVVAAVKKLREFAQENQTLIKWIAGLGAGLVALGAVFAGLAIAAKVFAFAITGIGIAIGALKILAIVAAFGALAAAIWFGAEAVLEFAGIGTAGFNEFVNSIKVGGRSIGAWMELLWGNIIKGFEFVKAGLVEGWFFVVKQALDAGGILYRGWMRLINAIADLFGWLWEKITGEKLDLSMVGSGAIAASQAEAAARQEQYDNDRKKRAEELRKRIDELNKAMEMVDAEDKGRTDKLDQTMQGWKQKYEEFKKKLSEILNATPGQYDPNEVSGSNGPPIAEYTPSKVLGSFSGRAVQGFGPAIQLQKEANRLLKKIADNTAAGTAFVLG